MEIVYCQQWRFQLQSSSIAKLLNMLSIMPLCRGRKTRRDSRYWITVTEIWTAAPAWRARDSTVMATWSAAIAIRTGKGIGSSTGRGIDNGTGKCIVSNISIGPVKNWK